MNSQVNNEFNPSESSILALVADIEKTLLSMEKGERPDNKQKHIHRPPRKPFDIPQKGIADDTSKTPEASSLKPDRADISSSTIALEWQAPQRIDHRKSSTHDFLFNLPRNRLMKRQPNYDDGCGTDKPPNRTIKLNGERHSPTKTLLRPSDNKRGERSRLLRQGGDDVGANVRDKSSQQLLKPPASDSEPLKEHSSTGHDEAIFPWCFSSGSCHHCPC